MADSKLEILAGALVVAAALGFVAYAGIGAGFGAGGDQYELKASFHSIQGVAVGADVKLAGVKVGSLTGLSLNPETYQADAVISLNKSIQLPSDSAILISSEGLLGGNYIELQPGGNFDEILKPGDEIEDTQGAVSLVSLLMKFVSGKSDPKTDPAAPAP